MLQLFFVLFFTSFSVFSARVEVGNNIHGRSGTSFSGFELRSKNKVGVGLNVLGTSGTVGAQIEANFSPKWGLIMGAGTNEHFNAFHIEYKRVLAGQSFMPYGSLGFARWYGNNDEPITSTNPSFLAERLMSSKDRLAGKVNENIIYPAVGIQYINLRGDWRGLSFFAQLNLFIDIMDLKLAPNLGLGSTYYF